MPFGLHPQILIIVLVLALVFLGPKRLPEMGASIGKSIKEFKKGMGPKEEVEPPAEEASRQELEVLEREVASKKAALAAQEAAQPAHDVYTTEKPTRVN